MAIIPISLYRSIKLQKRASRIPHNRGLSIFPTLPQIYVPLSVDAQDETNRGDYTVACEEHFLLRNTFYQEHLLT